MGFLCGLFLLLAALLLGFHWGNDMGGDFKRADEVKVNIYPLAAAVPASLALMDNDFFDKLVEHGRCQFGKISVAAHKLDKLICFQPVGVPALDCFLPLCDSGFQPGLFLVVFGKQTGKVPIGYLACGVALV